MKQWRTYLSWGTCFLVLTIAWAIGYENWRLPPGWRVPLMVISSLLLAGCGFVFFRGWLAADIQWPTRHASEMPPQQNPAPEPAPPKAEPDSGYPFPINRLPVALQDVAFVLLMLGALVLAVQAYRLWGYAIDSVPDAFLPPLAFTGAGYALAKLHIRWCLWRLGYAPPDDF